MKGNYVVVSVYDVIDHRGGVVYSRVTLLCLNRPRGPHDNYDKLDVLVLRPNYYYLGRVLYKIPNDVIMLA
jgi:hypothetical protein